MKPWLAAGLLWLGALRLAAGETSPADQRTSLLVVVGAPGEEEYGAVFARSAGLWQAASEKAAAKCTLVGLREGEPPSDRERLKALLDQEPKESSSELWLVLIGHGTFDGEEARFNLRGPDLSATELADWLKPFRRPVAVINGSSASAPFINKLSAPGRVIVTATRSGHELNYARFGQYLAGAIGDPEADLDKDGQTSLLEAFLTAARRTQGFYETEGRLATEHALLDDNGDGQGTPADWFRGIRAVKKVADGASVDGLRAHQMHLIRSEREHDLSPAIRSRRDELELAIAKLRETKGQLTESDYYRRLEQLLIELARLYEKSPGL